MGKKITDKIKEALNVSKTFTANEETIKLLCNDAIGVKCIAFEVKDDKLIRHYPPTLTSDQIAGGKITIIPFR